MTRPPLVDNNRTGNAQALHDAIHNLAQPLTALLFLLELGAMDDEAQALRATVVNAHTECLRTAAALEQIRSAAYALEHTGECL